MGAAIDLTRGFVVENEWFWKINENAKSLDAASAVRDFVAPLARLAKDKASIQNITIEGRKIRFQLAAQAVEIELHDASDRVALHHLVSDVNRAFQSAELHYAFALVVPRRYELRGLLLTEEELTSLAGRPELLVPSSRPSWSAIPIPPS